MATCYKCGEKFKVRDAHSKFDTQINVDGVWHELDYDKEFPDHDVCPDCLDEEMENWVYDTSTIMD